MNDLGSDIVCLEGNGCRPSHLGAGWSIEQVMYTLNRTEVHCVAYKKGTAIVDVYTTGEPSGRFKGEDNRG